MTWNELRMEIEDMPAQYRDLEASVCIETTDGTQPLGNIVEVQLLTNGDEFFVNCFADEINELPSNTFAGVRHAKLESLLDGEE